MSFKIVFALAAIYKWSIHKIDMKSAFTQGNIHDIIYIRQPIGFEDKNHPNWVLKLNRALYGLKQSANIWFNTLDPKLKELGFKPLMSDPCLYLNKSKDTIIMVYCR